MNLSIIERMVLDGDLSADGLKYLIECRGECEWLDHKEALLLESPRQLANFARDILAMKNVGGGFIVVGVRDKVWQPVGISAYLPYDTKLLRDKVRSVTGLDLDVDIVQHDLYVSGSSKTFALIYVRSSRKRRKRRTPSLVSKDFHPKESFGLRRGDIYVRRGDQTVKLSSSEELEDLLDRLEERSDQDALAISNITSPFAVETGLYRLLERDFDRFIGRSELRNSVLEAINGDPRIWIVNVHGPGGVGKSALANWATYEAYEAGTFESIIQLTAKETVLTPSGIKRAKSRSLYSLEDLLDRIAEVFEEDSPESLDDKKSLAIEILSAWKTLLVLDNMETVQDGRILAFVQSLPVGSRAKVLLTSRQLTGGWEKPISVTELVGEEVREFVTLKAEEMKVPIANDKEIHRTIEAASGGFPLAIQWLIGQYKLRGNLGLALSDLGKRDSPVLEFTFRNVWNILSSDARAVLAVMSIFEDPPSVEQIAMAMDWIYERVDRSLGELQNVTLVRRMVQPSDGRVTFSSLPITLSFAQHQLDQMGDLETQCRRRLQRYQQQMELRDWEVRRFVSVFSRYQISSDQEKRAAILCRRGESETFSGNIEQADTLFKQARELAPQSAYVLAMSASYELSRQRIGLALQYADKACMRATKATGALCYSTKARVLDFQRDKPGRVEALAKALEYDPTDPITRHQYGVALSRIGQTEEAIRQFTAIIDAESAKVRPSETLVMALKTRIINRRRLGQRAEAMDDLALADELIKVHPHLQGQAEHIAELHENLSADRLA